MHEGWSNELRKGASITLVFSVEQRIFTTLYIHLLYIDNVLSENGTRNCFPSNVIVPVHIVHCIYYV